MIRLSPWDVVANAFATRTRDARGALTIGRFGAAEHGLGFWITLWALVLAAEFAALVPVIWPDEEQVETVQVIYRLIGGSFAACGLIAWRRRPDSRSGLLMTAAGAGFFLSAIIGQFDPPLAQTASILVQELWAPFFVALVLTLLTGGRLESRVDWLLVGAFVLALWILQLVWLLFLEQDGNLLAAFPNADIADAVDKGQRSLAGLACVAVAVVVAARWSAASRPRRRALLPSVAGSAALLLFAALLTNDLVTGSRSETVLWLAICSLVTVPAAFLVGLLRSRLARGGLADLFRDLKATRGVDLQEALAKTLGDPSLVVAYRLPGSRGYADADGRPVLVPPVAADRSTAEVERDGVELAALVYDASLDDDPELIEAVARRGGHRARERAPARRGRGSARRAAGLARAHRRGQRRRAPAAGAQPPRRRAAAARRAVAPAAPARGPRRRRPVGAEELVSSASTSSPSRCGAARARARHPSRRARPRPRRRARLARRALDVPTTRRVRGRRPAAEPVELAAYFVASEALANVAKYAQATTARVRSRTPAAGPSIEIADDGVGGADEPAARACAASPIASRRSTGTLRVVSPPGAGTVVIAELPCAS